MHALKYHSLGKNLKILKVTMEDISGDLEKVSNEDSAEAAH
jgi:hypothetical protein